ncbi:MAG: hypothetical protein JWM59_1602 [Verrucomicrobiales bacterium]|nr:hypothetical protein [Verrucomicrobiales bacterium]
MHAEGFLTNCINVRPDWQDLGACQIAAAQTSITNVVSALYHAFEGEARTLWNETRADWKIPLPVQADQLQKHIGGVQSIINGDT